MDDGTPTIAVAETRATRTTETKRKESSRRRNQTVTQLVFPERGADASVDPQMSRAGTNATGSNDEPRVDLRVAQLLCSRLCHDLAGVTGAVTAGSEYLQETGKLDTDALGFVVESARQAATRLAFFRVAFGLGGGRSAYGSDTAGQLARGFVDPARYSLRWECSDPTAVQFSADGLRTLLCLVMIGCEALPRGGTLHVKIDATPRGIRVLLEANGSHARVSEDIRQALRDRDASSLSAQTVHAFYLARLADRSGSALAVEQPTVNDVRLRIYLPQVTTEELAFC